MLKSKVGENGQKYLGDVRVTNLPCFQLKYRSLIHDVNQVQFGHLVHFKREQFVLLRLAWLLRLRKHVVSLLDVVGRACGESSLDVGRVKELLHCLCTAWSGKKLLHVSKVLEELVGSLARFDFLSLLEKHAR